ncbi:hypothetical protein BC936DRAFT_137976 [Jimgerdemannia flammicorona]|uniref:Uncharacterized protein n=1 Tax=Jimgerdemannia flammicorona TaxID=994334 RepID=A0A433DIQ0_9FUNG|nr:hypothetical protein BC936DRAFT_137976 [Jimgerdemannia flammicorona]
MACEQPDRNVSKQRDMMRKVHDKTNEGAKNVRIPGLVFIVEQRIGGVSKQQWIRDPRKIFVGLLIVFRGLGFGLGQVIGSI